jgi:hypothetical protein
MEKTMEPYIVLYKTPDMLPFDAPFGFKCLAEDTEHAEEQCMDAYPDCEILWVVITDNMVAAYEDYWSA